MGFTIPCFTTPCFVLKNTFQLRKKLEEFGYRIGNKCCIDNNFLATDNNEMFGIEEPYTPEECNGYIHCGTNEELFLAIAALRDDTDENQWFIMDVEIYVDIPKGTWFQSTDRNGGRHVGTQIEALYCHKATVEELIEHFKGKEE